MDSEIPSNGRMCVSKLPTGARFSRRSAISMYASALLSLFCIASASAATVNTFDEGYYYNYDQYVATNPSYLTGQINVGSGTIDGYHSFFAFNALTGLNGPITSATLGIQEPSGGYSSTQTSETLTLTAVPTGDVSTLATDGTHSGYYNLLASSPTVGTATVTSADNGTTIDITLNATGISYLNSSIGSQFAFGGFLSSIPPDSTDTRFIFGGSENLPVTSTELTVTTSPVPEPGTLSLGCLGLLAIVGVLRCHRSQVAAS
jgi:hypothetical protein